MSEGTFMSIVSKVTATSLAVAVIVAVAGMKSSATATGTTPLFFCAVFEKDVGA